VAGLTFANGLRSLLRQDPNIIMVGEIRDTETADMSVNAAMTGHLVLSTLHTNNAFLAIQRLTEMGVQPFLAASVINLIIAQRLVIKVCPHCKSKSHITEKVIAEYKSFFNLEDIFLKLKKINLIHDHQSLFDQKFSHAKGCAKCNGTGYRGRIGIYEILKINDDLNKIILQNPSEESIKKEALRQGVLTMLEDGVLKVLNGQTTFEEVLRVTKE
jgi:type IV pilus assembly protein PilB